MVEGYNKFSVIVCLKTLKSLPIPTQCKEYTIIKKIKLVFCNTATFHLVMITNKAIMRMV